MILRIAIALTCLAGLLSLSAVASADEAEPLFDPAAVAEINFDLPPASLQKLNEEPETDEYQHAGITVKVGGATHSLGDVGFRLKGGFGSFRELDQKAAFKVKFNEFVKGQKLLGLKKLTLNNMVQDPSMVHETMVYRLFRALGVPAPRTGYAFVRVNGEPYGVYLNLETYDDVMLPRLFASTRHLFEADAAGVDVRPGEADTFEVDDGDDADLGDLEALIAAANDTAGDWSDGMTAVADLGEMTRMWAVERYAGHWDGYAGREDPFRPNNYYLHSLDSGLFAMLPWGTDQTWDVPLEFDEPAGGLLFNNCLDDASCEAMYGDALEAVQTTIPSLRLDTLAVCAAEMLAPWQELEDPSRAEYGPDLIAEGVADARFFMSLRPAELAGFLGNTAPSEPAPAGSCPAEEDDTPLVTHLVQMPPAEASPEPMTMPRAKLASISRKGKRLRVKVVSPIAGSLKLTAKAGGHRVCTSRVTVPAGETTVSCRLSRTAFEDLAKGPLRLWVKVRFPDVAGEPSALASRRFKLPRR